MTKQSFLVTGASDGIGAVYADRLARRGHDLILVARRVDRLEALAARLRADTGVEVDIIVADLADPSDLAKVEARLRSDDAITGLVNNAGVAGEESFASTDTVHLTAMVALNVLTVIRLSASIAPRLAATGGTIINISSVTALMPRSFAPVYTAAKAFVLSFSESLQAELGGSGVRIQAVLPGITRTAIWDAERIATVPAGMVMDVNEVVDAALAGFDLGETITIPSLEDTATFDAFLAARDALAPGLSLNQPATRYGDTQGA